MGSLFGLLAVALSAWLGFNSLKKANEHQAELRREEDETNRNLGRAALAAAIRAEIQNYRNIFEEHSENIKEHRDYMVRALEANRGDARKFMNVPIPDATVFNANAAQIGILGVDTATKVVFAYAGLQDTKQYQVDPPREFPPLAPDEYVNFIIRNLSAVSEALRAAIDGLAGIVPPDDA